MSKPDQSRQSKPDQPEQNESAGRVKSTQPRPGDHYLKAALGIAALPVSRSKTTYLAVKYRRIQSHAGALRAVVALQHTLLVIVWNMLHDGVAYEELGIDHDKTNPERAKTRLQRRMASLGFERKPHPAFRRVGHLVSLVDACRARCGKRAHSPRTSQHPIRRWSPDRIRRRPL